MLRGIPSALFNSSLDAHQRREVVSAILENRCRLLYVAPERFADDEFVELLRSAGVQSIAVDEAHCISHWDHAARETALDQPNVQSAAAYERRTSARRAVRST